MILGPINLNEFSFGWNSSSTDCLSKLCKNLNLHDIITISIDGWRNYCSSLLHFNRMMLQLNDDFFYVIIITLYAILKVHYRLFFAHTMNLVFGNVTFRWNWIQSAGMIHWLELFMFQIRIKLISRETCWILMMYATAYSALRSDWNTREYSLRARI